MWNKLWANRDEFYPYIALWLFWSGSCFGSAVIVKNRPGIMTLGLVTIPAIFLLILAIIKTYREFSSGSQEPYNYTRNESGDGIKGIYVAYIVLFIIILASTYLHHFQPQVLKVPSNSNVSEWQRPAFEETLIYGRMTEDEKQKILKEGIPPVPDSSRISPSSSSSSSSSDLSSLKSKGIALQVIGDLLAVILSLLCFIHARKHYGFWLASCFLIGSFVFTGLEESAFIISGRIIGGSIANPLGIFYGSYWFTKGGLWFFETPIIACLGWYFIAYTCVLIAGKIFPKTGLMGRAAIGAMTAVLIDLWQDPAITSPETMQWVWSKGDSLLVFGIPMYNFTGWFTLIFLFAIFWEKLNVLEEKLGRRKTTAVFFTTCVISGFIVYGFVLFSWYMTGHILSFFGALHPVYFPQGW